MISNLPILNLGLSLLLLLLIAWQILRVGRLNQVRKHFYSQGLKKNLEQIVIEQDQSIKKINENLNDLSRMHNELAEFNKINYKKMGFVRYSPFGEAGNLSFALALLNAHNDGFIISSLHGREGTRLYAKDITNGKSKAKLTQEEDAALKQAMDGETTNSNKT